MYECINYFGEGLEFLTLNDIYGFLNVNKFGKRINMTPFGIYFWQFEYMKMLFEKKKDLATFKKYVTTNIVFVKRHCLINFNGKVFIFLQPEQKNQVRVRGLWKTLNEKMTPKVILSFLFVSSSVVLCWDCLWQARSYVIEKKSIKLPRYLED